MDVMQVDSIERSLQPNRLLQQAGSQRTSLSLPERAGMKSPLLECTAVRYQRSLCRLKSVFLYGLVNTNHVSHPVLSVTQISTPAIDPHWSNLSGRQTCAPAKAIKAPAKQFDGLSLQGGSINTHSRRRKSSLKAAIR